MDRRSALKRTALLSGITLSPGIITSLLSSCSTNNSISWNPVFYSTEVIKDIKALGDDILPRTATPSASDVGVEKFIDVVTKDCMEQSGQDQLVSFFSDIIQKYGEPYSQHSKEERQAILNDLEELSYNNPMGASYRGLKSLIIMGYFTSEEGLKSNLNYRPVPGKYEGCITINENDKILIGGRV